jgi:signal transduction histidine kinase/PAS domain-containing protein
MNKFSLRGKLWVGFIVIVIFLALIAVLGITSIKRIIIVERGTLLAHEIESELLHCRRQEKNIIIRGSLSGHVDVSRWADSFGRLKSISSELKKKGYISQDEYILFSADIADYGRLFEAFLLEVKSQGRLPIEALEAYDMKFAVIGPKIEALGKRLIEDSFRKGSEFEVRIVALLIGVSLAGVFIVLLLGYKVISMICFAMSRLEETSRELTEGSLELSLGLSEHFDVLKKVSEGSLTVRAREDSKNELIAKLGEVINLDIGRLIKLTRAEVNQLYDLVSSGVRIIDKDFNVIRANRAMKNLAFERGADASSLLKCYEQLKGGDCFTDHCVLKQILEGKEKIEKEVEKEKAGGEKAVFLLRAVPYRDGPGNIVGVLEEFIDISELKRIERESEAIGLELSIGVSEVFEVAKKLAKGDVSQRVVTHSHNELFIRLASVFNQIADTMEKIIEDDHEMAMGFCEHFDALMRISAGDMSARAAEDSRIELTAKLGSLINKQAASLFGLLKAQENLSKELKLAHDQVVQSAKMASIGVLAGGVAHEINNPLSGVLNNVQLINMLAKEKKDCSVRDVRELLDVIEEAATRCKKITESLLNFSHISKGISEKLAINEILDNVLGLIEHELSLQNIIVKKDLLADLPLVSGDPQLLQQVFFDLIANARWAMQKKFEDKPGQGTIAIKTEYETIGHSVGITISDNGIGISKGNIARVFEPFFTTKDVGEGTGLGLSIVYSIVKSCGGTIEVVSEVGLGTQFKIKMPVAQCSPLV